MCVNVSSYYDKINGCVSSIYPFHEIQINPRCHSRSDHESYLHKYMYKVQHFFNHYNCPR